TISELMRDFSIEEQKRISKGSATFARDTFCEITKGAPVIVNHVRDEAGMRARSFTEGVGPELRRGRYSEVLNHSISVSAGGVTLRWFTELQALERKDHQTLAA
ncbi:unnamed protein product, partial [Prorocentrum cordatum]